MNNEMRFIQKHNEYEADRDLSRLVAITAIFFLIFWAVTTNAFGQSVPDLQAKAKQLKINKEVFVSYDKFKDLSFIRLKPYNLIGAMEGGLAIVAGGNNRSNAAFESALIANIGYQFKTENLLAAPEKYLLVFTSSSNAWIFLKGDRKAYFLYDRKRLELTPIDSDSDSDIGYTSVSEQLAFEISKSDLEGISQAKKVEIKLGPTPRKLKSEFLERIQKSISLTATK